ncbi:hypothetical protein QYF61_026356 [Mycteria americana]|uniref:Uncharacterized protein n=1 Tax=Mycteria americana TaxID=33587 RepID=A0AAN7MVS2_MYCAM|nr:hypothetical protein QYF61_026356 [Mycteria americana]
MLWVGRDLYRSSSPTPLQEQGHLQLDQVAQSPVQPDFECSQERGIYHLSGLNLPSLSLKPLLLVLSQQALLKREVFHPSDHLCDPPLDPLQQLHVLLALRAPELDAVLQVGSHHSRAEGQNHLPPPAGHASFDAAQKANCILGCIKRSSLDAAQNTFFIHQYPQVLLSRAALNPFIPQPVLILGVAPTQVPLDDIPSFWRVNCTTQLGVICKLAEGALNLTVNVICPCFHCLGSSLLLFSLTSMLQLSHAGLFPSFPDFLHLGTESSCTLWKASLKICRLCSAPLSLRTISQGVLLTNSLKSWKFAFLKFRVLTIILTCPISLRTVNSTNAASHLDVTDELTCIGDHQIQYRIPSRRGVCYLG